MQSVQTLLKRKQHPCGSPPCLAVSVPSVSELIMMYAGLRQIAVMYWSCLQTCFWLPSKSSLWFRNLWCSLQHECFVTHSQINWVDLAVYIIYSKYVLYIHLLFLPWELQGTPPPQKIKRNSQIKLPRFAILVVLLRDSRFHNLFFRCRNINTAFLLAVIFPMRRKEHTHRYLPAWTHASFNVCFLYFVYVKCTFAAL